MKKMFFLFIFVFLFILTANAKEQFVNPIFNQPLKPLGRSSTLTYITPTSIDSRTPLDDNLVAMTGDCQLIENTQNRITLLCDLYWHNPDKKGPKQYFVFKITERITQDCLRIAENDFDIWEDYTQEQEFANDIYCVTPPDKLESD